MLQFKKVVLVGVLLGLYGCQQEQPPQSAPPKTSQAQTDTLGHLSLKQENAQIALPFCENKQCIQVDIQTIDTQDDWMNQWLANTQGTVIQDLIDLDQKMTLQQAVDAYVKQSDLWREQSVDHQAFELQLSTRIASQRGPYVLVQLNVHATQGNQNIEKAHYFFVADRFAKRTVKLLDLIDPKQQLNMNEWVQSAYQNWLKENAEQIEQPTPEKIYWGQADWFFDSEGIGLHYRADQIVAGAPVLNIYLTQAQTQQVLKPELYADMFK